jgi:hypothetical protein
LIPRTKGHSCKWRTGDYSFFLEVLQSLSRSLYIALLSSSVLQVATDKENLRKLHRKLGSSTPLINVIQYNCAAVQVLVRVDWYCTCTVAQSTNIYAIVGTKKQGCYSLDFGDEYYLVPTSIDVQCPVLLFITGN